MIKSRNRIATAFAAAIACASGLASNYVDAAAVIYPGAQCKARPVSSQGTIGEYGGTLSSTHSSNDLQLICPLIHYTGSWIEAATVRVFDRHTTKDVSCSIVWEAEFANGSVGGGSQTGNTTGNATAPKSINLSWDPEDSGNYLYGTCRLPNWQAGQANPSHVISWKTFDTR